MNPIKRPVVELERGDDGMWRVKCAHCAWTYGPTGAKSDAGVRARYHRAAHRAGAV